MDSVLILHASAGSGHRSVARAIADAMPDTAQALVADILSFGSPLFRTLYGRGYEFSAKYMRWFVHMVFALTDHPCTQSRLVNFSEEATCAAVQEVFSLVRDNGVNTVLCTHFLPVALMCRLRRKSLYHGSIHVCVTDYDVHGFWFDPDVDLYHVASQRAVEKLASLGVERSRIHLSGIPVRRDFCAEKRGNCQADAERTDKKGTLSVLFMASSLRHGECLNMLSEMDQCGVSGTVHLVTGRNTSLCGQLERNPPKAKNFTLVPHGFVRDVAALMRACDLMITKPGGITVTEGLVQHIPMLFVAPIPLHEVQNARILEEAGAGLACFAKGSLGSSLHALACEPSRLERMRMACKNLARPNAARAIGELAVRATKSPMASCAKASPFARVLRMG